MYVRALLRNQMARTHLYDVTLVLPYFENIAMRNYR